MESHVIDNILMKINSIGPYISDNICENIINPINIKLAEGKTFFCTDAENLLDEIKKTLKI